MRLAVPIELDVGNRFPARLMTHIPMYDIRPDLVCGQCIVDRPAAGLERELNINVSDGMSLTIDCAQ